MVWEQDCFEYGSPDEDNNYKYTIGASPFAKITRG
jgi:hypothetical protein